MTIIEDFINNTTLQYLGGNDAQTILAEDDKALTTFITDPQCLTLNASNQNNSIEYQTEVSRGKSGSLIFFKSSPISLVSSNAMQHVGFAALPGSPVESLYLSLRHVYAPLLQTDNSMSVDPKVQELLAHLEAALRAIAYGKDGGPSLLVVLTVDDEVQYWKTIAAESKTRKQKDMADAFVAILQPISEEIRSVDGNSMSEIKESLDSVGGLLDDLWRHPSFIYPQKRMTHLMDVIGNACVAKLQEVLSILDVWSTDGSSATLNLLGECRTSASAWLSACSSLTQRYWPHHSLHPWEGPQHSPAYLQIFYNRLQEIFDVRSVHLQLTKLLSSSEQQELKTAKMFETFSGLNLWQCTPKNNAAWSKSKSHFERLLKPAEDRIAEKLKPKLTSSSAKQMLNEFVRYAALIDRPTVRSALRKEREFFVETLGTLLKEIQLQAAEEKSTSESDYQLPEISPLVQHIQWTKQMMARVAEIQKTSQQILNDLNGNDELQKRAELVQKDLHNLQTQLYEDWTRDLQMELNKKSLILSPESPVVEFSAENNLMRVTFNPRLVSLERNVRHMSALGFVVPTAVREAVNHAAQFMEHARALQLVASFHNTQGDRMIACQRPMMLKGAMKLASLVQEQAAVPWKDIKVVAQYVDKLKDAVSNLVNQNSYLTDQHNAMRNIVLTLMDTDLVQKQAEWKKGVRNMRDIVDKVESQGFTNNQAWKIHWDMQLYKALDLQYRSTLINPLIHLPSVRAELIFRQQSVQLQPPLEELRTTCHSRLRKVVSLPLHFVGIQSSTSEGETVFASIVSRNSSLVGGAMLEIEKTLEKVVEAVESWSRWGALGAVDLESLCELHLAQPQDWDRNFKECKALGQAIAKLPMEDEQIDWVWLSSGTLRGDLEAHNRRYWAALNSSLQGSLQQDCTTLEGYIQASNTTIRRSTPRNAKELAEASEEFQLLKEKEVQMAALLEGVKRKQNMARSWGGERARPLENLARQWEALQILVQGHEQLIIHQAESVKASLLGDWSNLTGSLEVWLSRWGQNRPKPDQLSGLTLEELISKHKLVEDAAGSWEHFKENRENMINECKKFNFELEIGSSWKETEKSLQQDIEFWEPFKMFNVDLNALSSQEWIVFQKKLHTLDEFAQNWSQKLEPFTPITLFIQKEINQYKDIIPSLKHLRGTDFTESHWREIFSLLEMPQKAVGSLLLADLLKVAHNIKPNAKTLQKIWSSASNEAVVRGAVSELELWLAGARLVVVQHKDARGQDVPIIRDYKDTINKVEEFQSLVGSARSGGASGDQLALWETRLAHLSACLTSLAHVQRKSVHQHQYSKSTHCLLSMLHPID